MMTDGPYEGVCIGGPLDGRQMSHPGKVFMHMSTLPLPDVPTTLSAATKTLSMPRMQEHRYVWTRLGMHNGFWRLETIQPEEALEQLLKGYVRRMRRSRKNRRRKRTRRVNALKRHNPYFRMALGGTP